MNDSVGVPSGIVLAGTGHRPGELGGYSDDAFYRLVAFAEEVLDHLAPAHVISGMALGWDTALALAAMNQSIPWTAAVPFKGQEKAWPNVSQERYHELLQGAEHVYVCYEGGYEPWKMQGRNEWMVDRADVVLACWNGTPGGTANCVAYAERKGKKIVNVWDSWAANIK